MFTYLTGLLACKTLTVDYTYLFMTFKTHVNTICEQPCHIKSMLAAYAGMSPKPKL